MADMLGTAAQPEGELDTPIILDDNYQSPEAVALRYGAGCDDGLLAGAVLSLSMSEHRKSYQSNVPGYPTSQSYQDETYVYAQPEFAPPHQYRESTTASARTSEDQSAAVESTYQEGLPFQHHHAQPPQQQQESLSFLDVRARQPPIVQSYNPLEGTVGTKVFVYVSSTYDFTTPPETSLWLTFGTKRCYTNLTKLESRTPYFQYLLTVHAPTFDSTGWVDLSVALYLRMEDEAGQVLSTTEVGDFRYISVGQQQTYAPPQTVSRKRKSSVEHEITQAPAKRASTQHMRQSSREEIPAFSYTPAQGSPYSPYVQSAVSAETIPIPGPQEQAQKHAIYQQAPAQQLTYQYTRSPTVSQPNLQAPSPQTPSWSPSYAALSTQASRSPRTSTTSASTRSTIPTISSPARHSNPPLIRTSTLQHSPSSAVMSTGVLPSAGAFNPYAMYPHKAVLDIHGDLDSMAHDWTEQESAVKRRIVHFRRRQSGNTIHTSFKPVGQDERPPQSICISCIWWEERQECFVTSVDTIYLLEALVAVRFTVEEKNRIRRNLEGFRPLTVSKAKADSEEFFKIIMAFPNPKPRNIEKDVKVFPWKILAHALKKIIGKYSASYSSTAGALPSSMSSSSLEGESSTAFGLAEHSPEPDHTSRRISESLAQAAFPSGMDPTTGPMTLHSRASAPDLRLAMPHLPQPSLPSARWVPPQYVGPLQYPRTSGQTARRSWDMATYMEPGPEEGSALDTAALYYHRTSGSEPSLATSQSHHSTSRV